MPDTLVTKRPDASAHTPAELARRTLYRRAMETINWGIPAVVSDLMLQAAQRAAGARINQILFWSHLPDWKNQTLTPNPDSIYFMPFFSTAGTGPLVLEVPPADDGSITGSVMDWWQIPLEDVGPAGVDKGKGGKYLILRPGHADPTPAGYIALPSTTFQGYGLLRSILKGRSDADVDKAVAYGKRLKLYPLSQAADPPATAFVDAVDVVLDSTVPYDLRFFQSLDRVVQAEPWIDRDRVMIDLLKSVGIEKGKAFAPDAQSVEILEAAALEALARFDGSVDVFFGPAAPASREANWIPTRPGGRFEALFRFYGPEPALFEKTWVLPDIEKVG